MEIDCISRLYHAISEEYHKRRPDYTIINLLYTEIETIKNYETTTTARR